MILYYINSAQKTISDKKINNTPIFKGWYAYPEGVVFEKRYCVYPTFSAGYGKQVFLDAFSSFDLTHWKKHPKILDTIAVKWEKKTMCAPSVIKNENIYFLFFSANDIQNDT